MGFFKKIGKLAKGISLKNAIKVSTGNYGEVLGEFGDRAKKEFMTKNTPLTKGEEMLQSTVTGAIAGLSTNQTVQQAGGVVGSSMVTATIKQFFLDHWKKMAIGVGVLIGIKVLLSFTGGSADRTSSRRR